MKGLDQLASDLDNAPRVNAEIVWRFKDNKGWRVGTVREVMAGGKVVKLEDGRASYGGDLVSVEDIEWHLK